MIRLPQNLNWRDLLFQLFPGHCVLCSGRSYRKLDLCPGCELDLPRVQQACWQCGLTCREEPCPTCRREPPVFVHCFSALSYEPPVGQLVQVFKEGHQPVLGEVLSTLLGQRYLEDHLYLPDVLVPVPLHPARLRQRGFNQAEEIARVLSRELRVPLHTGLCIRVRDTGDQKRLDAVARQHNMRGAFQLTARVPACNFAIVDDVVTTGTTATELTRLLLGGGAASVQVLCLARTPK